jgi:hypothetical protein
VKYTKQEREDAIEACAMMSSSNAEIYPGETVHEGQDNYAIYLGDALDSNSNAAQLVRTVLWASKYPQDGRACWAEAECLLREGWEP